MRNLWFVRLLVFSLSIVAGSGFHSVSGQTVNTVSALSVVSGRIIDGSTGEVLPFASVQLIKKDDLSLVSGTMTNEEGRFLLAGLPEGEFFLQCSYLGYTPQRIPLLLGRLNKAYDMQKILMVADPAQLEEVTVTADRNSSVVMPEKQIYNVASNLVQAGGSVMDAMKSLPGIQVDQEGKVLLRGSDKVAVLIDGQQSALTGYGNQKGLESVPVANIEKIEIINNPSARYDAGGMAGIINLIYKKEKQAGLHGDVGFSYGLGALSKRRADVPSAIGSYDFNPKYIPSINLNYKTSKVGLFLQAEVIDQERLPNNEFTTRHYDSGSSYLSQVPENRKQTHYILKGGADYSPNAHNTFSISGVYDWERHIDVADYGYFNLQNMISTRNWAWKEEEITGFASINVRHKYKFAEPGHELTSSFQYTRGWEDEEYQLKEVSTRRVGNDTTHIIATEHITQLSADYVKPLRSGRLELGAKGQIRRIPISYKVQRGENSVIYEGLGDWSDWDEDMISGYGNLVIEKPGFELEAGLRAEYTFVSYRIASENIYYPSNDKYQYFSLFPNVRYTLKMSPSSRLSAFYNRRIDRPGEAELRIFPKYDDPEMLKTGNPYLRPQYTQSAELAYKYNWKGGNALISVYFKHIDDPYTRIYAMDAENTETNIVHKVYQNTGQANNTGFELVLDQKILPFWTLSGSYNWYRNVIKPFTGVLYFPYQQPFHIAESKDNTWFAKINNAIRLSSTHQFQLSAQYFAPKNIAQGRELERWSVDMGFKQTTCKGKVEITLAMADIFNTMGLQQKISNQGFTALYQNYYETQIVSAGVKYKF